MKKRCPCLSDGVKNGEIPTLRGHKLSEEDRKRRAQILQLMTTFEVALEDAVQLE